MNIQQLKQIILENIIDKGIETSKNNILGNNTIEDKVYTKKINVNAQYNGMNIVCISITNDTPIFNKQINNNNIRVNMKNHNGVWCNLFINEIPKNMMEFIYNKISK